MKKYNVPANKDAKSCFFKFILEISVQNPDLKIHGNEGARTRDKWGHSGNGAKKSSKIFFFIKLMIVDIDALAYAFLPIWTLFGNNMLCVHKYFTNCTWESIN